jgi:UDP-N-acetylglucosamine 2-epimerase
MKIATIIGARPQFIKAAAVSRRLRRRHREILIHTGQHYDDEMSGVFFRQLDIPEPTYALGIGSGTHGAQTGKMLAEIERVLLDERPDWVLVYGDTNSTLAGALAGAKLHIPVAHIEAGLRSFNRRMPEETNRVVTDHISSLLLCPSQVAVSHLAAEGICKGVRLVGDVMGDAFADARRRATRESRIHEERSLKPGQYWLATLHRAENTDDRARLEAIVRAFDAIGSAEIPVVFAVHPRTRKSLETLAWCNGDGVRLLAPLSYLDMVALQVGARGILTDSGGVQKEAYWAGVPCTTLRDETEWTETVELGWNALAGADTNQIVATAFRDAPPRERPTLYWDGNAADAVVEALDQASSGTLSIATND